ncbi:imm11 family protein [Vreelandella titanicae]|uniref:imm11 family protein n=1 Tax=Vreelandella titanicae TaxID=664683 RepID=UPI0039BF7719
MSYRTLDARVWATNCLTDADLIYAFVKDNVLEDEERAIDTMERALRGEALPTDSYPKEAYVKSEYHHYKKLPDIFSAGGLWVVSGRFAEVLRRFELGQTGLYPVKLFHHDRKTPFEGEYFVLAFGETKDTFVPEESSEASRAPFTKKDIWKPSLGRENDGLALSNESLQGVDLWMEKKMRKVFFLSDRLVEALKAEKLTKPLKPYRCRVVSNLH